MGISLRSQNLRLSSTKNSTVWRAVICPVKMKVTPCKQRRLSMKSICDWLSSRVLVRAAAGAFQEGWT